MPSPTLLIYSIGKRKIDIYGLLFDDLGVGESYLLKVDGVSSSITTRHRPMCKEQMFIRILKTRFSRLTPLDDVRLET